jgi:hypothetical protein
MLQSFTGMIRLFPNTQGLGRARFQDLRAVGAFLVSASYDGRAVSQVTLLSEKGATAKLANPWPKSQLKVTRLKDSQPVTTSANGEIVQFPTQAGERYRIEPA